MWRCNLWQKERTFAEPNAIFCIFWPSSLFASAPLAAKAHLIGQLCHLSMPQADGVNWSCCDSFVMNKRIIPISAQKKQLSKCCEKDRCLEPSGKPWRVEFLGKALHWNHGSWTKYYAKILWSEFCTSRSSKLNGTCSCVMFKKVFKHRIILWSSPVDFRHFMQLLWANQD